MAMRLANRNLNDVVKKVLLSGKGKNSGLVLKLFIYIVLFGIGFVYLYPILYMLVNSFMGFEDLINPTIEWVPTALSFDNYIKAFAVLDYLKTTLITVTYAAIPTLLQTFCTAMAGYSLGRFDFPFKKLWTFLLIVAFIIPVQVMVVPRYLLLNGYGLIGNPLVIVLPALLGQGIKSTLFVLIFMAYFKSYPKSLDEAAELDGASRPRIFFRIALPMAIPTIIVALLFTFVWYWNETYELGLYLESKVRTLPIKLSGFVNEFSTMYPAADGSEANRINESIRMSGTILTVLPLILMYLGLQNFFIEGIESSGITGE